MLIELRIQQLADNIRQDLELLKGYEDELRYETDPRRLAKYRREIERQRESLTRYRQEYDELCGQGTGAVPAGMQDTADMLHQMDAKLDGLLSGQKVIQDDLKDFRKTLQAAKEHFERALEIFRKFLGEEHPSTATVRNNLRDLANVQGRVEPGSDQN